jgi:threonine synthase
MVAITYRNLNDQSERVSFKEALLKGQGKNYGLFMIDRADIPKLKPSQIKDMRRMSYPEIATQVLSPFLDQEIPRKQLEKLLFDAYDETRIPSAVQSVMSGSYITKLYLGPTSSFKDYAARFFGRTLNHFLANDGLRRTVLVATSGDTGGAVADALHGLDRVNNVVFFPRGSISEGQRRQMTTLLGNVYAFAVNGDFDVCQALVKRLLGNKEFAQQLFEDPNRFTSANSISVGRLLPQAVYPFYAHSRISNGKEPMIASIPSGNFGDMMGTVIAKEMGLPISRIVCGVNENSEFPDFLHSGKYEVKKTKHSPSSAMNVAHPSNLVRLIDFYGGYMLDIRDVVGKVIREGVIRKMPDMGAMHRDIVSMSIPDEKTFETMREVYETTGITIDPHTAVGWAALNEHLRGDHNGGPSVVYATADPGKFPIEVKRALGFESPLPPPMLKQSKLPERIFTIDQSPDITPQGPRLSSQQYEEAKSKLAEILRQ